MKSEPYPGAAFPELRELVRVKTAITISSPSFMTHHVIVLTTYLGWQSPATYLFSTAIAIGGGAWAGMYDRSGTLDGAWAGHLLVDAAILVIGYDPARDIL